MYVLNNQICVFVQPVEHKMFCVCVFVCVCVCVCVRKLVKAQYCKTCGEVKTEITTLSNSAQLMAFTSVRRVQLPEHSLCVARSLSSRRPHKNTAKHTGPQRRQDSRHSHVSQVSCVEQMNFTISL